MRKPHLNSAPLITFLLALGVYLLTIAPDLTWAHWGVDGGELIAAATTLGVPHPPGYPTYTVLAHLFTTLPIGSIPFRFNLFSAVSMAFAAAMVTMISQSACQPVSLSACQPLSTQPSALSPQPSALSTPVFIGLTFAFAPLVWSQAVITEVYALNLACLALFLWLLMTKRPAFVVGLALGLSLTTHLSSGLMLPLALWGVGRGRVPHLLSGFLLGLTPFLLIPLLAQNPTPVVWGDPSTLSGWLWLITGQLFASNVFALPLAQWPNRLAEWGWTLFIQFTPAGLPLILYGLVSSFKFRVSSSKHLALSTQHSVLSPHAILITSLSYTLYAFTYTSDDAVVFLTPAVLGLSILLTFGLRPLGRWGIVLPLTLVALNFGAINLRQEVGPRPQAEYLFQAIPPQALVLTPGDETLFTLWALQQGEGQRPDIILVDTNLFAFDWYRQRLARLYPHLTALTVDDSVRFRQLNQTQQPVCEITIHQPETLVCYGINP
jgi:hypothetical protein